MAQMDIQKAFIDGLEEIFETMFTDGVNDGVEYYYLDETTTKVDDVYRESKNKKYGSPILLVTNAKVSPAVPEESFKDIEYGASFKVPLKCLMDNKFDLSPSGLKTMRKGKMKFHGKEYKIANIKPTTFVENVFLVYEFVCEEI